MYAIQWAKVNSKGTNLEYEIRTVTNEDLEREQRVINFMSDNLEEWQNRGYIPDMVIEEGYNTNQPIRERGWTHWHHLFNPRQLLIWGLAIKYSTTAEDLL